MRILSAGSITDEIIDAFLDWSAKNTQFIKELGGEVLPVTPGPTFAELPGSETMLRFRVKGPAGERGGASLWNLLSKNVEQRKIRVYRNTPVKMLLRANDGVAAVEGANREGNSFRVRAQKAVILATGGFELTKR